MNEYHITPKPASSVDKAASGVMSRKTAPAPASGQLKTGKGHFAAAAQRIAKKRGVLLGVPKHAPMGGPQVGKSGIAKQLDSGRTVQASEAQSALNPKQQGATNKKSQRGDVNHSADRDVEERH